MSSPEPIVTRTGPGRARLVCMAVACSLLAACSDAGKPAATASAPGQAPMALPVSVIAAQATRVPLSLEAVAQAEGAREIEVRALGGVDLEIEKEEFCAIVGPSGSGKTTLLKEKKV